MQMGLDANGVKFLLYAKRREVDFSQTATIGRQSVIASAASIAAAFEKSRTKIGSSEISEMLKTSDGYCESLLKHLGAQSITSFDASDYENASRVHDFNFPIAEEFRGRYSAVLDGGTLEHVFNYPVALKNCLEMVAEGGHFLAITPANNFLGHGFYQFSPELFFNVFGGNNGFELIDLVFFEDYEASPWYQVADPRKMGARITLQNAKPAYLLVIATRTSILPIFSEFPQQSDYSTAWKATGLNNEETRLSVNKLSRIPRALGRRLKKLALHSSMRFDPEHFSRFEPF